MKKLKKCIVCEREIKKGAEIKKFQTFFCGSDCVKKYEKLLEETKKKMSLDECC